MYHFSLVKGDEVNCIFDELEECTSTLKEYTGIPFDTYYMNDVLAHLEDNIQAVVVRCVGEVVGFSVITFSCSVLSPDIIVEQVGLWVNPDFRDTSLADTLMECSFKVANDQGATKFISRVSSGERVVAAMRFFKRHGLKEDTPLLSKEL